MYNNNLKKYNFNMEEIKLFDSFAGIGALHKSLQKLGVPTKLVGISEIDVDAIISYTSIYSLNKSNNLPTENEMRKYLMDRNIGYDFKNNKSKIPRLKKDKLIKCYIGSKMTNNYGDISLINSKKLPDFDLFNFSFPCTNISVAGRQEGMKKEDGSITSSGLYIYGINIIKEKKPKYIMIENVKNLISKKFIGDFNKIISELENIGYNCHYPTKEDKKGNQKPICLNAKNYGIPQNRERIFVICVRKDIENENFKYWKGKDLGIRLKDILADNVDEKFYLSTEKTISIINKFKKNEKNLIKNNKNETEFIINDTNHIVKKMNGNRLKKIDKDMYTLTTQDRHGILQNNTVCEQRSDEGIRFFKNNICGTIRTVNCGGDKRIIENNPFKIRKLTPLECWRLMGFDDEDFYKAKFQGMSDTQLYKQAGNSIVVNCLYYIFKELFKEYII